MKLKLSLILFISLFILSCDKKNKTSEVFLKGQIANPSSEYVIISKNNLDIDTLRLDNNNQFQGTLKGIKAGLYQFRHPPENQIIYLEPGDSTMVWLNTLAFDESLNFSGKGSEKSNFLTDLYLLNQQDNDLILSYYKSDPSEFAKKTDSIRANRKQKLMDLVEKSDISQDFYAIANSSINYEYYDLRERYAFLIRKYNPSLIGKIPADFHEYRNEVSFNYVALEDSYVYLNFIDDFLRTKTLEDCAKTKPYDKNCTNLNSFENIRYQIELVDSLIQNKNIKNTFLDRLASQGIIYSQKAENVDLILNLLKKMDYSGNMKKGIAQMAKIQSDFLPGNSLGEKIYINTRKDTVKLKSFTRKPMITYRWKSSSPSHYKWQQKIIKDLQFKYPEVAFIGINLDMDGSDKWIEVIKNNSFDPKLQFQAIKIRVDENLLKYYLNKLIFMDSKGTIARGDLQINTPDLENKILEFISQQ
ncbi:hypothetical protein JM83_3713 [Gillisia sp. Hel_I_86]|uniref:hypothetical protein n=1 Tax=Gillisia sp. Hel_I_86 TaxID=1249981 RepID=UPI001199C69C|nr:hypothetical protein [Gillisia sp. Hel_I_86]TVZ28579.1 hypothetical protein JM83_3713 [Gillisia sp. Hel_I_86]